MWVDVRFGNCWTSGNSFSRANVPFRTKNQLKPFRLRGNRSVCFAQPLDAKPFAVCRRRNHSNVDTQKQFCASFQFAWKRHGAFRGCIAQGVCVLCNDQPALHSIHLHTSVDRIAVDFSNSIRHKMTKSSINSVIVWLLLFASRSSVAQNVSVCVADALMPDAASGVGRCSSIILHLRSVAFFIFFQFQLLNCISHYRHGNVGTGTLPHHCLHTYAMRQCDGNYTTRNDRTICCTIAQMRTKSKLTLWPIKVKLNLS